ncbi:MAG: hypothetical protein WCN87_01000 [Chlamydiota bacterium]
MKKTKLFINSRRILWLLLSLFVIIALAYKFCASSHVHEACPSENSASFSHMGGSDHKEEIPLSSHVIEGPYCPLERPYYPVLIDEQEYTCITENGSNQGRLSKSCDQISYPSQKQKSSFNKSPQWGLFSCCPVYCNEGWSFDIGGQFTWMSLTSSSSLENETGSGGGVTGKITYQQPHKIFAQLRGIYNRVNTNASNKIQEAYAELVAGYCVPAAPYLSITPYLGLGYDRLKASYSYETYYAILGLDTHYAWAKWKWGAQFDFYLPFQQQVKVGGSNTSLAKQVGCAARLPIARRLSQHVWLELTPYYRFFVLGSSKVLEERDLNEAGAFLTLRIFVQ